MGDNDQEQKTEQPTEKRLSEAHDRGQFPKSHEFTILFPIAAVLGVLMLTAQSASRDIAEYAVSMFTSFAHTPVQRDTVTVQLGGAMFTFGRAIAPVLVGVVIAALLAAYTDAYGTGAMPPSPDDVLTITPSSPDAIMRGTNANTPLATPKTFTPKHQRQSLGSCSQGSPPPPEVTPALLNSRWHTP